MPTPPDIESIRRRLSEHAGEVRALGIVRAAVFGSVARGEAGPRSDVDLLVKLRPEVREGLNLLDVIGIEQRLSAIVGGEVYIASEDSLTERFAKDIEADVTDVFH